MKIVRHKKLLTMIVVFSLLFQMTALAEGEGTFQTPPSSNINQGIGAGGEETDIPTFGYIGTYNNSPVDIDGDGQNDLSVDMTKVINVTVPLYIKVLAQVDMSNTLPNHLVSPKVNIRNNGTGNIAINLEELTPDRLALGDVTTGTNGINIGNAPTATEMTLFVNGVAGTGFGGLATPSTMVNILSTQTNRIPINLGQLTPNQVGTYEFTGQTGLTVVPTDRLTGYKISYRVTVV